MKRILAPLVLALPLILAACGGDSAPPASPTAAAAVAASATVTPAGTATPAATATEPPAPLATSTTQAPQPTLQQQATATQQPAPAPTAPPSSPPPPVTLNQTARNIAFSITSFSARRGAAVTVNFRNEDEGLPHDVTFSIAGLPHGNTCFGPCTDSYSFTAPAPGSYQFFCTTHAEMLGTFTVTP